MKRKEQIEQYLRQEIGDDFDRLELASEDASFRKYYRIKTKKQSFIIMDAPPDKESTAPFIDITGRLQKAGVNVPAIFYQNQAEGILVMTDFGETQYFDVLNDTSVSSYYSDAIRSLVAIQKKVDTVGLPHYSSKMLYDEMALFREWLIGKHLGVVLSKQENVQIDKIFSLLVNSALNQPTVFVHRDYHSRNLLYVKDNNPGIIDHQDAVLGPVSYDLVSLLKDCYIKWPLEIVQQWAIGFYQDIELQKHGVSEGDFLNGFHLMGVQRHLKASGIFARLYHRDGKTGYLQDIHRTLSYITDLKQEFAELALLVELIESRVLPILDEKNQQCMP